MMDTTTILGGYSQTFDGLQKDLFITELAGFAAAVILTVLIAYFRKDIESYIGSKSKVRSAMLLFGSFSAIAVAALTSIRHLAGSPAIWMSTAITPYALSTAAIVLGIALGCSAFRNVNSAVTNCIAIVYSIALSMYVFQFYAGSHIDWNMVISLLMVASVSLALEQRIRKQEKANKTIRDVGMLLSIVVILAPYSAMELRLAAITAPVIWMAVSANTTDNK